MNHLMQALPWLMIAAGIIGVVLSIGYLQDQVDEKDEWWGE